MTRRKSVCLEWTLVLLVVIVCPYVHSRPQDPNTTTVKTETTTENLIRYSLRFSSVLPVVSSPINNVNSINNRNVDLNFNQSIQRNSRGYNGLNRIARLMKGVVIRDLSKNRIKTNQKPKLITKPSFTNNKEFAQQPTNNQRVSLINHDIRKPTIKKVLTKWKDETKYEDLNLYQTTSEETDPATFDTTGHLEESIKDQFSDKRPYASKYYTAVYKPQNEYSEEMHVYSTNVQIADKYPTQSTYMYTNQPSPTPEITNVGYPKPWQSQRPQVNKKPTTQKPVQVTRPLNYNYHNSIPNYPSKYEVTTFQPASAYTERIVIRPEEYSGTNDECPTIYLTLNNTFQGQAKEACPDLNIAVNTNVINQNNVIETEEEEDSDSLFPNGFGIPLADDSAQDDFAGNDYFESNENPAQSESASVEGTELSNYNAANSIQSESSEPASSFSPSSPLSALSKPGRPNKDEDDLFSFSSLVDFFRPAINALGWLASINPFAIGFFPLFLAPIAFLFAGSGIAALFSPWFLPLGREAPKIIHVYRPHWHWDDTVKTWHLHSFPDNRNWKPSSRSSTEEETDINTKSPSLFEKLKQWMLNSIQILREKNKSKKVKNDGRKNKRKRREVWSIRVK